MAADPACPTDEAMALVEQIVAAVNERLGWVRQLLEARGCTVEMTPAKITVTQTMTTLVTAPAQRGETDGVQGR